MIFVIVHYIVVGLFNIGWLSYTDWDFIHIGIFHINQNKKTQSKKIRVKYSVTKAQKNNFLEVSS